MVPAETTEAVVAPAAIWEVNYRRTIAPGFVLFTITDLISRNSLVGIATANMTAAAQCNSA